MAVPTEIVEKAQHLGMAYNRRVKAIQEDRNLSAEGRQKLLAREYTTSREQMAALRDGWKEGVEARRKALRRDLFGSSAASGTDAISVRDATDRASRLTKASDAERLLRLAENNDDTVLARAIAQHAFDQASDPILGLQWMGVLDVFAEGRPQATQRIEELVDGSRSDSIEDGFREALTFSITKPADFGNAGDWRISQMAAE